ncbi:peroxisomal (S)-2-hydroxy-acid oxidase GLO3-like [Camellia sinensis]|uniref:peroxisomal (S)-2-hydroxy-acid oxidase GLO3-like n=1 Tax=Camellia sinensis TaxID=4442 RepID=UPI0010368227|nr:peroxisomal (S)-2-hydroxy-acid oxidase GLO3-like [Camellia sinensis]
MAVMASEPANVNEFQELARQALPKISDFSFCLYQERSRQPEQQLHIMDKGSRLEAIATGMLDASLSWKVVRAVGGKNHVLFDGGVRRGTDISKVGRPVIYGLAAKGEYGVRRVIEMLKDELELTIALSGCPTVNDIIKSLVRTELDGLNCWL